jgi:SAM-dependent methyltransferase
VQDLPEEPAFDLVFVDGSHLHADVASDLAIAARLLRPGGILAGHDFGAQYLDVLLAVLEFAVPQFLELHIASDSFFWFYL